MDLKVSLLVKEGKDKDKIFNIAKPETILGRKKGDILIDDSKISSKHAKIIVRDNIVEIEDMLSTNGILVNGQEVERIILKNLDEITIGLTKLSILIVEDLNSFRKRISKSKSKETTKKREQKDIESMIEDELSSFSSWDLGNQESYKSEINGASTVTKRFLQILDGSDSGQIFNIEKINTTIGRGDVDIVINDKDVSRKHASVEIMGDGDIYIRDLASTNGIFVNEKKISYAKLKTGDTIKIGGTLMRFG